MYPINHNPTYSEVCEALDHGIKANLSPALKTFVVNINGIARMK